MPYCDAALSHLNDLKIKEDQAKYGGRFLIP